MNKKGSALMVKGGPSLNPKGAPQKDESLTFLMKQFLKSAPKGEEKTYKEIVVQKTFALAMKGEIAALKLLWSYHDGAAPQSLDMTSNGQSIAFVTRPKNGN